ncbi:MAG: histidine triad nucleotide-binding protein [Clostridiales Family XIII bacterium]|jgi:diadenosine tetraphosphate (Ap4A) HIT family hydrolase|nr:histidine triad nucleotide-binding protein [Clostridiales Family XIII bacterium]
MDCIFCGIVAGEIPSDKVYEDESILAFRDLEPQAPEHVLVIPKKHIPSLDEMSAGDGELVGHLVSKVRDIAAQLGLGGGYRLVANNGKDGQQTVQHLHFHLLGGRQMTWPPG